MPFIDEEEWRMIQPYNVACIQTVIRQVRDPATRDETVRENLYRSVALMEYAAIRFGQPKLVVLPEFFLTGADHLHRTIEEWTQVACRIPGPETDVLGEVAQEFKMYIAGGTMEYDPKWPNRWFNSAFIIGPNGDLILKYRKHNGADVQGHTTYSTPSGCHTDYVAMYGEDGLFPVADTPIGKLGCLLCYDMNFPEVARALALRGVEVLIYPTGEPYGPHRDAWESSRRTRAYENMVYIVSVNHGAYIGPVGKDQFTDSAYPLFQERRRSEISPVFRSHGHSEIVDFEGKVVAVANGPGEAIVQATIDVGALRQRRSEIKLNFLAQLRSELYASETYDKIDAFPLDHWRVKPIRDRREGADATKSVIHRFLEQNIYLAPETTTAGA